MCQHLDGGRAPDANQMPDVPDVIKSPVFFTLQSNSQWGRGGSTLQTFQICTLTSPLPLLSPVVSCCLLLPTVVYCCLLLPTVAYCCPMCALFLPPEKTLVGLPAFIHVITFSSFLPFLRENEKTCLVDSTSRCTKRRSFLNSIHSPSPAGN